MSASPTSLDKLHDIIVPDSVPWWPLAPGWYVIILGLFIAATWIGIRLIQQWRGNRFRREALSELEAITPCDIPALIKRVALSVAPREQVASLSGDDWLDFLNQSGNTNDFTGDLGETLTALSYCPKSLIETNNSDFVQLKAVVRTWILSIKNS